MRHPLPPAIASARAAAFAALRFYAILLAAAGLAVVAGCGAGEERLSGEEFSDLLESIDRRGAERYGRVAQRAADLKPDQPLPADAEQPLRELVSFQRQAVEELEGINPPEGAEEPIEMLIAALRGRTKTIEQALDAGRFTLGNFHETTALGDKIDEAFAELRNDGFLHDAAAEPSGHPSSGVARESQPPDERHRATLVNAARRCFDSRHWALFANALRRGTSIEAHAVLRSCAYG